MRNCCEELNCWNCPRTLFIAHKRDGTEPCSYKPYTSREGAGNFIIIDISSNLIVIFDCLLICAFMLGLLLLSCVQCLLSDMLSHTQKNSPYPDFV